MRTLVAVILVLGLAAAVPAQSRSKRLDLYLIDVEGGGATLFVTPSGESVLIDTGNGGVNADRDVGRIMEAIKDAGLSHIDHLITTHWHGDHYGGLAELAKRVSIRHFYDHGPNRQPAEGVDMFLAQLYPAIHATGTHTVVEPGDRIPVSGLDWRVVTSAGAVLDRALPGAGKPNPFCAGVTPVGEEGGVENSMSVGSVVTFGKFRLVHLGDLTQKIEAKLMCPVNLIGIADLFVVSHHGQPYSNGQMLVHAIQPRVDILNNGTRKGGQPDAMKVIFSSPGLEDLWQLHFSLLSGQEYTAPGMFIANSVDEAQQAMPITPMVAPTPSPGVAPPPAHGGKAYWIKVTAQTDGTFTVTNTRNGFSKTYRAN